MSNHSQILLPKSQPRNTYIDYLKGILIFLVAYGHVIQYIGYHNWIAFFDDPVFAAIYSFHMPLFMAVSGYLSHGYVRRHPVIEIIKVRFLQLIVPVFVWAFLVVVVQSLGGNDAQHIVKTHRVINYLLVVVTTAVNSYWFLWSLFFSSIIVSIAYKQKLDRPLYLLILLLLTLFIPNYGNIFLFQYIVPFFYIGYLFAEYQLPKGDHWKYLLLLIPLSILCYFMWGQQTYIYVSKMTLSFANMKNILVRIVAGVSISLVVLTVVRVLWKMDQSKIVINFGRKSLAIYILQIPLFLFYDFSYNPLKNSWIFVFLVAPILSFILCYNCLIIEKAVSKIPAVRLLLLGSRT